MSRSALEESEEEGDESDEEDDEEYDDPDEADLAADEIQAADSEIDSDDALGESDVERYKGYSFRGSYNPKAKRATAADFMSEEEVNDEDESEEDGMDDGLDALVNGGSEEEDDDEEDDGEDDEEDEDDEDEEEDEEEDEDEEPKKPAKPNMGALSKTADVEKGIAIQKQRKVYDGLLNLRIRLQKALIAANSFSAVESDEETGSEPYEAAEEAAVKLLNTISSLRDNFGAAAQTGDKRKHMDQSMSTGDIWAQLQAEDDAARTFREARLEKWSKKVQSVNMTRPTALSQRNKTLIGSLQEQLLNPDGRLVKRTRVPRSCAPAQATKRLLEDDKIYDDADFYQMLLKELVGQRTVETTGAHASAVPTVMVSASKEPKIRKQVDRKASKGRKMRFTVHEKLQNFMAPEDRRAWEQSAIDRFFGTLFGQKMELNEEDSDEDMESVDDEEGGLRLF